MRSVPRFTIVSAVHNVEAYLPDFIASIEAQTFDLARLEVILIDDGSTDSSAQLLDTWARRRPETVRVIRQANAGQGAARNVGLEYATGEWVTFTDPDDTVSANYLAEIDAFLTAHPAAVLAGTYRILHMDGTGEKLDTHPLRKHFTARNRLIDLDKHDDLFYGSAPCAFFRLDLIRAQGRTFDDRIRPNFEDGHFTGRYLLDCEERKIGFVTTAQYYYRKRSDKSSTLQTSLTHPGRYTDVPRYGYLDLLEAAAERYGAAPAWVQTFLLYELSWFFSAEDKPSGSASAANGDVAREFLGHLSKIRAHLSDDVLRTFDLWRFSSTWRDAMLALGQDSWRSSVAVLTRVDVDQRLLCVSYRYAGQLPTEEFRDRGRPLEPVVTKIQDHTFFDHAMVQERIVWLPLTKDLTIRLDGQLVQIREDWPAPTDYRAKRLLAAARAAQRARPLPLSTVARGTPLSARDRWTLRLADSSLVKRVFGNAWVLMDRVHDADDSAELLFRHLRHKHRGINAWFVIEDSAPDHARLRADGYRRVVPYGSLRWKLLLLNAAHLASSHADAPVINPREVTRLRPPRWRFTFLQHGVIKDDISRWLNPKPIDLFVTSTPAELDFVGGDHSPFRFTRREVTMAGLPRFDRLYRAGHEVATEAQDLILVTPTWRFWLAPRTAEATQHREMADDLLQSDYVRQWRDLLASEELKRIADERGLTIAFMPHPNMELLLDAMRLPAHVKLIRYVGTDIARTFARAGVLVTDYSSVAFNAAYMDRPVVYFQFDAKAFFAGAHVGRGGYFEYERDGFGPVRADLEGALSAIDEVTLAGRRAASPYAERIAAAFPTRDGRSSERVVAAMKKLRSPRRGAR
ncbi:bifunctional glycosyltransferase/CDP-glycerol:glycerophosphate glycerophosphotransferase [Flavimobilis marinus]|nr:CDP-glycerol glycerophosphotransferase family protein [Flavimobilis marinus]